MQAIDLFSGAGGMSIGAEQCGIQIRYAVEAESNAATTFKANHPETNVLSRDIRTVKIADFVEVDPTQPLIVFGGPPCQGFSTSNQKNRDAENANNWLYREFIRVVRGTRPNWIVFENVKGLIETENGYFLTAVLAGFKRLGYTTSHFVLNSADYGVPQTRNRLFIVGSRDGISITPPATLAEKITVRQAIGDLPTLQNGDAPGLASYSKSARNEFARTMRGRLRKCHNNIVTNNAPHIIERYGHIPPGGNWADIPIGLMENYKDVSRCHTGIYRRLDPDRPSIVIGNFRKNMLIHPWQDRGLSVREAARLQSFPDAFRFYGSIGFQQQQVGNAVPPKLAEAVFRQIVNHI